MVAEGVRDLRPVGPAVDPFDLRTEVDGVFAAATAIYSSLLAIVVVTVGGLLPAWRTSRLQIVDAIRDE